MSLRREFNNPRLFLKELLRHPDRTALDIDYLLLLLDKQQGRCALTGELLTFQRGHGNIRSNASIDRIDSSQGYSVENVQLVCRVANIMKNDMTLEEFLIWAERAIKHAEAQKTRPVKKPNYPRPPKP